jgi:predicted TIM-barrel fold metal-dependent hydrolase
MNKKIAVWLLIVIIIAGTGATLPFLFDFSGNTDSEHSDHSGEITEMPTAGSDADLRIFDTHIHYKEPAWSLYTPAEVITLLKANGVTGALVSSTPDEGTRMLYEEAPEIVVPFLRPYHDDVTSSNWHLDSSILKYIDQRLDAGIYRGIGEFHIHNPIDADSEIIQKTVRMALEEDLYIHVHTNHEAIESLFEMEPDIKILWAHAGMSDPPELVSEMFDRFENLWIDTSIRARDIAPGGVLSPEWKALFLKHPDRITLGSDTWVNSQWERYDSIISQDRAWLLQLPEDVARMIAYGNAERLFR